MMKSDKKKTVLTYVLTRSKIHRALEGSAKEQDVIDCRGDGRYTRVNGGQLR